MVAVGMGGQLEQAASELVDQAVEVMSHGVALLCEDFDKSLDDPSSVNI